MSNLWVNIRFWKNWFFQFGPNFPWFYVGKNIYQETYKTKFAVYEFFWWHSL